MSPFEELSSQEKNETGYSHKAVISASRGDFTAAATTQTYTLAPLPVGTYVKDAAYRCQTFLTGGAVTAATVQLGKTGTANAYVTPTSVFTGGTAYKAGDGASFNQAGGEAHNSASSLIATVTTTTANVSALTAGEIHLFVKLVNMVGR